MRLIQTASTTANNTATTMAAMAMYFHRSLPPSSSEGVGEGPGTSVDEATIIMSPSTEGIVTLPSMNVVAVTSRYDMYTAAFTFPPESEVNGSDRGDPWRTHSSHGIVDNGVISIASVPGNLVIKATTKEIESGTVTDVVDIGGIESERITDISVDDDGNPTPS